MNPDQLTIHDRLHALADGQLDAEQTRYVLAQVETDLELQKELCEIQRIKHLVKSADPSARASPAGMATSSDVLIGVRPNLSCWRRQQPLRPEIVATRRFDARKCSGIR